MQELYLQRPVKPEELDTAITEAMVIAKKEMDARPRARPSVFWDSRPGETGPDVTGAMTGDAILLIARVHSHRQTINFPSPKSAADFLRENFPAYQWKTNRDGKALVGEMEKYTNVEVFIETCGSPDMPAPVVEISALKPSATPEDIAKIANLKVGEQQAILDVLKS